MAKFLQFSEMNLSKRLLTAMLIIGLLPLTVVGVISYITGSNALYQAELNMLDAVRSVKRDQIESYFVQIQHQVRTMSESTMIVDAMREMRSGMQRLPSQLSRSEESVREYQRSNSEYYKTGFGAEYRRKNSQSVDVSTLLPKALSTELAQYLYVSQNPYPIGSKDKLDSAGDSSSYSQAHQKYHPKIRNYLHKFGYYDIFLIEPEHGQVVYSVFKEVDFATRLSDGPYRNTNLAKVFNEAVNFDDPEQLALVDFSTYLPSYNNPASFIATPIFDKEALIGVLVFQMPVGKINKIMHNTEGLGESGETYIVGNDGKMRSQSRFSDYNTVLEKSVEDSALEAILAGESGRGAIQDYRGVDVLSSYSPLTIEGLTWGIVAEIDESEALAGINASIYFDVLIGLISALGVTFTGLYLARSISTPISQAAEISKSIANGQLDNKIEVSTQCEVGGLLNSLSTMQTNLRTRIAKDKRALAENTRIKQALDNVSGNVLVVDNDGRIAYLNHAYLGFLQHNQAFFPALEETPSLALLEGMDLEQLIPLDEEQLHTLKHLQQELRLAMEIGPLTLALIANQVISHSGERLGVVIELVDRTQEVATEKEVQFVVDSALQGDLTQRIDLSEKQGYFSNLSMGVNQLVDVSEQVIDDTQRVVGALAVGDLSQSIERQYKGAFEQLKLNVNATVVRLTQVVEQIQRSSNSVKTGAMEIFQANGNLNKRTEQQSASLEQTAASMEVFTEAIQKNASFSQRTNEIVQQARESAEQGGEVIDSTIR
ncbi:MAG: methyl-accepting chemotaxis protein, partial [Pseudomonadales bacterium]